MLKFKLIYVSKRASDAESTATSISLGLPGGLNGPKLAISQKICGF